MKWYKGEGKEWEQRLTDKYISQRVEVGGVGHHGENLVIYSQHVGDAIEGLYGEEQV